MPSNPSEFVRLPEYGEWARRGGAEAHRYPPARSVWCALTGPNKNIDPGPGRNTRNSLGDAQSQLLPLESLFMSAPPAGLTASLCHRSYCSFLAGPCFLSQDRFLSLSLSNRLRILAGIPPALPAMPAAPGACAGQPSWGLQVSLQNIPRRVTQLA